MNEEMFGVLPEGWEQTTLGDVCRRGGGKIQTGPFGSQLHASDYVPVGIPTVMPANIGDNRIVEDGIARVRESDALRLARHRLYMGDIVYSRRGDVERRAFVRPREVGWLCGTGCLLVRVGENFADSFYISLWLAHPQVRAWITQHAVGATMANLNTEILSEVPVVVPPFSEQRAIAGVLGALDDKVESNRRIKDHLRIVSELLLRRSVGCPIGDSIEADEDFRLVRVDSPELSIVKPGLCGANSDEQFEYLATAVVFDNSYESGEFGTLDALPSRANMRPGDDRIWFARMKSTAKSLWTPRESNQRWSRVVLSTGFLGLEATNPQLAPLLMTAVRCHEFEETKNQLCNGTTMQSINNDAAKSFTFRVPSRESELTEISNQVRHNLLLEEQMNEECDVLTSIRDSLLPELLSGRLRVRDAEKVVEGAV